MSWSLHTEAGEPITLEPLMPPDYQGPQLMGARVLAQSSPGSLIVVQELPVASFLLRLVTLEFPQARTLITHLLSPNLKARIQLEGTFSARLEGVGRLSLRQSQYSLLALQPLPCRTSLEKEGRSSSLDVLYPESALRELTPVFPRLEQALDRFAAGKSSALTPPNAWASASMLALVRELLACPFSEGLREVYLENKIRELLLLQLHGSFAAEQKGPGTFSQREVAAAYEARRIILSDLERHYTIRALARQVGVNDHTLKQVFKSVFGTGPFECLLQARMERAREELLSTDKPIKAIASLTGYEYLTSFITAFRKYFGYTPASLRRKEP